MAVRYSVSQCAACVACVAVCCSVLQCVAVCCSVLQRVLQRVLHCVAACGSVLQFFAACRSLPNDAGSTHMYAKNLNFSVRRSLVRYVAVCSSVWQW